MSKVSLKMKLVGALLLAGLVPMLSVGIYSYTESAKAMKNEAIEKLIAVRDTKGNTVKRYFEGIRDQVLTFSHSVQIQEAMEEFDRAFKRIGSDNDLSPLDDIKFKASLKKYYQSEFAASYQEQNKKAVDSDSLLSQLKGNELAAQYYYISSNPNPLGSKEELDFASDTSRYSRMHKRYHPTIREYLKKFGYYDIFLIDIKTGNIVYSVFKELDYGTSLLTGPYRDTNFADAFRKAKDINDKSSFVIVDYKKYLPSYDAPASFIATPIWKGGRKIGIAVFQMPIDRLNDIMNQRSGMGESGEIYMVGSDKKLRSDTYLESKKFNVIDSFKKPSETRMESLGISEVLKGKSGSGISENYLKQDVVSAYRPIDILGLKWGLIAEVGTHEAFSAINKIKQTMTVITAVVLIALILFALFLSSMVSKDLARKIKSVADKLLDSAQEVSKTSDEISTSSTQLSNSAMTAAASLQETVSSIDEINSMIKRNAESANHSTKVSEKSSQAVVTGKKTVESMINSINEISGSNEKIVSEMHRNNEEISRIVSVISEIGEKTKVINDIVFQTKLLSFNASVEAARAGEHGKGFAVVAEEVGNLASMSGKAALEITDMLDRSIRQVTEIVDKTKAKIDVLVTTSKDKIEKGTKTAYECGESLDEILRNVTTVDEMVREIAIASSEQSTGVQEVTKAMRQLDDTTHQNTSVAQESSARASLLKTKADELNLSVHELMTVVFGKSDGSVGKGSQSVASSDDHTAKNVISINHGKAESYEDFNDDKRVNDFE